LRGLRGILSKEILSKPKGGIVRTLSLASRLSSSSFSFRVFKTAVPFEGVGSM